MIDRKKRRDTKSLGFKNSFLITSKRDSVKKESNYLKTLQRIKNTTLLNMHNNENDNMDNLRDTKILKDLKLFTKKNNSKFRTKLIFFRMMKKNQISTLGNFSDVGRKKSAKNKVEDNTFIIKVFQIKIWEIFSKYSISNILKENVFMMLIVKSLKYFEITKKNIEKIDMKEFLNYIIKKSYNIYKNNVSFKELFFKFMLFLKIIQKTFYKSVENNFEWLDVLRHYFIVFDKVCFKNLNLVYNQKENIKISKYFTKLKKKDPKQDILEKSNFYLDEINKLKEKIFKLKETNKELKTSEEVYKNTAFEYKKKIEVVKAERNYLIIDNQTKKNVIDQISMELSVYISFNKNKELMTQFINIIKDIKKSSICEFDVHSFIQKFNLNNKKKRNLKMAVVGNYSFIQKISESSLNEKQKQEEEEYIVLFKKHTQNELIQNKRRKTLKEFVRKVQNVNSIKNTFSNKIIENKNEIISDKEKIKKTILDFEPVNRKLLSKELEVSDEREGIRIYKTFSLNKIKSNSKKKNVKSTKFKTNLSNQVKVNSKKNMGFNNMRKKRNIVFFSKEKEIDSKRDELLKIFKKVDKCNLFSYFPKDDKIIISHELFKFIKNLINKFTKIYDCFMNLNYIWKPLKEDFGLREKKNKLKKIKTKFKKNIWMFFLNSKIPKIIKTKSSRINSNFLSNKKDCIDLKKYFLLIKETFNKNKKNKNEIYYTDKKVLLKIFKKYTQFISYDTKNKTFYTLSILTRKTISLYFKHFRFLWNYRKNFKN